MPQNSCRGRRTCVHLHYFWRISGHLESPSQPGSSMIPILSLFFATNATTEEDTLNMDWTVKELDTNIVGNVWSIFACWLYQIGHLLDDVSDLKYCLLYKWKQHVLSEIKTWYSLCLVALLSPLQKEAMKLRTGNVTLFKVVLLYLVALHIFSHQIMAYLMHGGFTC